MDRFLLAGTRLFSWVAVALLVLGTLTVPERFASADSTTPYTIKECATCPNPTNNPCFNNNNKGASACAVLACTLPTCFCTCVYDGATGICSCP